MTLVEVIVTLVIIALVVVPFSVVFYNTLNASSANAGRQNASLVAATVLSHLDSASYSDVGFTSSSVASAVGNDSAYASSSGGGYVWTPNVDSATSSETLALVTTQPSFTVGSSATTFAPIMSGVISGGTRYTVYTHVVDVTGQMQACGGQTTAIPDAYRRAFVEVTWHNGAIGNEQLYQDKLIYPGGLTAAPAQSSPPAVPQSISATPRNVTGEVIVSWSLPSGWTQSTSCFKVGWADVHQNEYSSGFLSESSSDSTCPSVVGSSPPTTFSVDGSKASYCVTGLLQGGANQAYTFYVTAYSMDGTASSESSEAVADAPLGPVITGLSESSGQAGDTLTLTGSDLATTENFEFCSFTVNCAGSFSAGCQSATQWCVTPSSCPSSTQCVVTVPTISGATSGVFYVIAETTTNVTSAPQSGNEFTYTPKITGAKNQPSNQTTTVTGTNLYQSNTSFLFGGVPATNVSCVSGGGSCTMTVPDNSSGNPLTSGTTSLVATDNGVSSPSFTYTY